MCVLGLKTMHGWNMVLMRRGSWFLGCFPVSCRVRYDSFETKHLRCGFGHHGCGETEPLGGGFECF